MSNPNIYNINGWTKVHGDKYRTHYPKISFKQKQFVMNKILNKHLQTPENPIYLLASVNYLVNHLKAIDKPEDLKIVELGGYNGDQAYTLLQQYPKASWTNYDISLIAEKLTKPELANYNYKIKVLDKPFWESTIEECTMFYSSKMIEHLRFEEICKVIDKTENAISQVHIIDWWWTDDTHVIEENKYKDFKNYLKNKDYVITDEQVTKFRTRTFAVKKYVGS